MFSGSLVFHGYRSFKCWVVRFPATKNTDLLTGSMSAEHAGRTVLATERQLQVRRNEANGSRGCGYEELSSQVLLLVTRWKSTVLSEGRVAYTLRVEKLIKQETAKKQVTWFMLLPFFAHFFMRKSKAAWSRYKVSCFISYGDLPLQVGGISDETVKYGREFCGVSTQVWLLWQGPEAIAQLQTRPLVREGATK
jgi:hypothetical protein